MDPSPAGDVPALTGGLWPGTKHVHDFAPNEADTITDTYDKTYGKVPGVKEIHAGLEWGNLGAIYPNRDMISFGPTVRIPHAPDEMVYIGTGGKF